MLHAYRDRGQRIPPDDKTNATAQNLLCSPTRLRYLEYVGEYQFRPVHAYRCTAAIHDHLQQKLVHMCILCGFMFNGLHPKRDACRKLPGEKWENRKWCRSTSVFYIDKATLLCYDYVLQLLGISRTEGIVFRGSGRQQSAEHAKLQQKLG